MTVRELYNALDSLIPRALSCDWDNDGLMCCPEEDREVRRVLIALDITGDVIKTAVKGGYDAVISHHPLIFHPLRALDPADPVAKKCMDLLRGGVAAMSFHTRLDAVEGGVNDVLAGKLGLLDVSPFGGEGIGRIGTLPGACGATAFAEKVKAILSADAVFLADAGKTVRRVALLGGSGGDEIAEAMEAGADTYVTGELRHNHLTDAPEMGINLISAGHHFTEDPVCERLRELVLSADPAVVVTVVDSYRVKTI